MIRATYERPDGTRIVYRNDVRSVDDHLASLSHTRRQQSGYRLVNVEKIGTGGHTTFTRNVPPLPRVEPESLDIPPRGIDVRSVQQRRIR